MPRKNKTQTISLAASIMGKKGGQSRSAKKVAAAQENIQKALRMLTADDRKGTFEARRAAQLTIPEADRKARAVAAVRARWAKRDRTSEPGMDNAEFRKLTSRWTATEIAEGIGVGYSRVVSWRRLANPVRIGAEDAKRIRAFVQEREHSDRLPGGEVDR